MLTPYDESGLNAQCQILGGGPACLAFGRALEELGRDYFIFEKATVYGGNARTVQFGDTGPHRFHAMNPEATQRVMDLLGNYAHVHDFITDGFAAAGSADAYLLARGTAKV